MQLRGARILLTGATGGLGGAIARELHRHGAELVVSGRRAELLDPLAAELGARAVPADLAERREVERLAREAGPVDVLVANAALPGSGRLATFAVAELDRVLDVNLRAPIVLARLLLEGMLERRRGQLVFVSSLAGKASTPGQSLYQASKFGLRGFALGMRSDLRGTGVGVSTVFPGFIRDAGMFAATGVRLPPWVRTRRPQDVAAAVARAVEGDLAEVDVAPLALRLGAMIGGLAPELSARATRRSAERIAREMNERQAGMR